MNEDGSWRLAPAYDITYIIDRGGYLPNEDHCMYIQAKLHDITRSDVIEFARDNGIRRPELRVLELRLCSLRMKINFHSLACTNFQTLSCQLRSSVHALQVPRNGPCSAASNGFWVGEERGVGPTGHRASALACCLSTRNKEPLPPHQYMESQATRVDTYCDKSPPNSISLCCGSP